MNRQLMTVIILACTSAFTSCEDGTGSGLLLNLFLMFWIGVIPAGLLFWIFGGFKSKENMGEASVAVFIILSIVLGYILNLVLFR